jgi:hypothetical protein
LELGSQANWSEANREKNIYLVAHPRQYLPLEQAAECKLNENQGNGSRRSCGEMHSESLIKRRHTRHDEATLRLILSNLTSKRYN